MLLDNLRDLGNFKKILSLKMYSLQTNHKPATRKIGFLEQQRQKFLQEKQNYKRKRIKLQALKGRISKVLRLWNKTKP